MTYTLNQLSGRFVNVVLTIEEGRGLDYVKGPIALAATFNGRVLESDAVEDDECPVFNTELVWEIEKKEARNIRSSNQPLRVELIGSASRSREKCGNCLLSLRSAEIISLKNLNKELPFKWEKLKTGKKHLTPELYLCLSIRDHNILPQSDNPEENVALMPYISEEDTSTATEVDVAEVSSNEVDLTKLNDSNIPIKYLEDGYISIGDDSVRGKMQFALTILVKMAANLELLLPEVLVFGQTKKKFYMLFKIFGIAIKTKPFEETLRDKVLMNERIVVRLLATKETLYDYLSDSHITVTFYCGKDKLGLTRIELNKLQNSVYNDKVKPFDEMCYFKFPSPNGIIPCSARHIKPYLELQSSLQTVENNNQEHYSPRLNEAKGSGDFLNSQISQTACMFTKVEMSSDHEIKDKEVKIDLVVNNPMLHANPIIRSKDISALGGHYTKYVFEVACKNFNRIRIAPEAKCFIKMQHPKASSYLTSFNPNDSTLCQFKLFYISTSNQIDFLLKAWPPKVVLLDGKENVLTNEIPISTELFFENMASFGNDIDVMSYQMQLHSNVYTHLLAKCDVYMTLSKCNAHTTIDKEGLLLPPVLDEDITVREVEELDLWKQTQRQAFTEMMKQRETEEIAKIKEGMKSRKLEMEAALTAQLDRCKKLQKDMEEKAEKIRNERLLTKRIESAKELPNSSISSIKDRVQKYSNYDKRLLLVVINKLELEVEQLKQIITSQNDEIRVFKKNALTKEQTTTLLQELRGLEEKFEDAQRAKGYFKTQWKKAYEEIHDMKTEDYKQLQKQIEQQKEELSHLSLDHFVKEESEHNFDMNNCENEGFRTCRSASYNRHMF